MATPARRDPLEVLVGALASPVLNAVVGIVGIAIPILAWVNDKASVKNGLFALETAVVVLLVVNHIWLSKAFIQLRRASNRAMSDAHYYDLVRAQLESELIADFGEIADGHLQVYASEVPRLSVLLFKTLVDSQTQPKRVLAADLTTNPNLLTQRREYLAANRRLIETGGSIDRLFICFVADLEREDYARALLQLVNHHRSLGVTCGLAVRDRLRADQAVDVVVLASAAALVEEDQGDADYVRGRSSVYFKGVERWAGRFESVWGHGSSAAPFALQAYEAVARPMLDAGTWDTDRARTGTTEL
ncbi:hypothetical protein EDD99_8084 [Streptomyces sp. 846.5]|nr:hypothetical protein [Streptomyces sp. 846.5]TDT94172.1 hypothetical protein EDD99_8084 [Streptomyces sp. 846.5]